MKLLLVLLTLWYLVREGRLFPEGHRKMRLKAVSGIMLSLLLIGMLILAFNIQPVKASGTIYIRADGSIEPSTANISTVDNVTYTFTDNIFNQSIVLERDNIVIDGAGHTVQGVEANLRLYDSSGISLGRVSNNVTIKNMEIKTFYRSIKIYKSINNSIYTNNLVDNVIGISLYSWDIYSSYNHIFRNNITNNFCGINVGLGSIALNNSIYENNITNNDCGIHITNGFYNAIYDNNIKDNTEYGIRLECSDNYIYHNNFINNAEQVHWQSVGNIWDDGYPSGGNYWSDYADVDQFSGPYQNETGSDEIWDHPYVINDYNQDNYPLISPWGETPIEDGSPSPFWMQWWLWTIVAVVIVALAGAVYFLKKRKQPTPTAPTLPTEGTGQNTTPTHRATVTIAIYRRRLPKTPIH